MLKISENFSLKKYNTFGIDCSCRYFFSPAYPEEIKELFQNYPFGNLPYLILAGGSNILFTRDFHGLVIRPGIAGIDITDESPDHIWLKVGSSENWDDLVEYCVERSYGGIENLSLIPGTTGAAPIQNIGAYGAEVRDVIERVYCIDLSDLRNREFTNAECNFEYRDSIFKQNPGKFLITHVTFKLDKEPTCRTEYGTIKKELSGDKEIDLVKIRQAVIRIRQRKLPDPEIYGNAGSFFKNPLLKKEEVTDLKKKYPNVHVFPFSKTHDKIAAAWLIEKCGWKGKQLGNAGVYKNQPLVLINLGEAKGSEIYDLARMIRRSVKEQFGIMLEREVNVI